jgi:hypothetical protein
VLATTSGATETALIKTWLVEVIASIFGGIVILIDPPTVSYLDVYAGLTWIWVPLKATCEEFTFITVLDID